MYNLFIPRSVGGRIRLYSILLILLPLLFASIGFVIVIRSSIVESGERSLNEQVNAHKVVIEDWFRGRRGDARFLAELDVVRRGDIDRVQYLFKRFNENNEDISAVVLVGPDGRTVFDTTANVSVDVSDREYFIKARLGEPHVTKVIIGRTSGKPIIIFSHPVTRPDGTFGGLVFLPAQLTAINELMFSLHFGKTGETYILNREGYMLTESRYLDELREQGRVKNSSIMTIKTESEVFKAAERGQQPDGAYPDYRGVDVLGASQWTKDGAWLIVSEIDYAEALGPVYPISLTLFGSFGLTLLIVGPIIYSMGRSIQKPLVELSDVSTRMTRGEFDQSCVGVGLMEPPREVLQLVDAFCAMQEKVDRTVQELEESAVTDQLTNLPNRRYLMDEGTRLVDIAIRAKQPCTVFMMDIDHFKDVNDTYGHVVGDTILRQMADTFRESVRSSDIVARYGGEEFAVVAPGSDIESSRILAERIRHAVEARTFNTIEEPLACTISIGIAHYAEDIRYGVDAYEDMLARADEALYQAKNSGRNQVAINEK